jgi:hypothetical protein
VLIYVSYIRGDVLTVKRTFALSIAALLPAALFAALMLTAAMCGLAASGHFPRAPKTSRSGPGAILLVGSIALAALSFAAGSVATLTLAPWYAVIIAGGLAVLAAPLILQLFSDRFVDGNGALVVFAAASVVLAIFLIALAIGLFHKTIV